MLQQTQVKTVLERYYTPFLKQFPTIAALAAATREEVLRAWSGLGYYRRAIHLHNAAQQCNGALPQSVEGLMALPGIGKNTAHAITSFAHGAPYPVMEANVKRVLCRLFASATPRDTQLWEWAAALASHADIFTHNQAMMDLGALVCTPKAPRCETCPVRQWCAGRSTPEQFPNKRTRPTVPVRQRNILIVEHAGLIYAAPREGAHLGGLYHFLETEHMQITLNGLTVDLRPLPHRRITHHYSHYTLEASIYRLALPAECARHSNTWWSLDMLATLPLSQLEKKALAAYAMDPRAA